MASNAGRGGGRGSLQCGQGDWTCPNPGCGNVNFARRNACNRCRTPKQEDSSRSSECDEERNQSADFRGPPGLFKPGDWTCTICGNVNWERRQECNICKNAKPGMSGLDEKRDGVAGGFNERQERVASGKTEIGEDGYDDFGMKKKKVKASTAEREAAALARLQQSYCAMYQIDDASHSSDHNQHNDTVQQKNRVRSPKRSISPRKRSVSRSRSHSRSRTRNEAKHSRHRQYGRNTKDDRRSYRDRGRK